MGVPGEEGRCRPSALPTLPGPPRTPAAPPAPAKPQPPPSGFWRHETPAEKRGLSCGGHTPGAPGPAIERQLQLRAAGRVTHQTGDRSPSQGGRRPGTRAAGLAAGGPPAQSRAPAWGPHSSAPSALGSSHRHARESQGRPRGSGGGRLRVPLDADTCRNENGGMCVRMHTRARTHTHVLAHVCPRTPPRPRQRLGREAAASGLSAPCWVRSPRGRVGQGRPRSCVTGSE